MIRQPRLPDLGAADALSADPGSAETMRGGSGAGRSSRGVPAPARSSATRPDCSREAAARASGALRIAGVDEVGRGALAGPVTAAAVILGQEAERSSLLADVRDSKMLSAAQRPALAQAIRRTAAATAVGHASPTEIDLLGIARATALAMNRALRGLRGPHSPADYLLVDGRPVRAWPLPVPRGAQEAIVRGDAAVLSIAAASIVAKVARDAYMISLAERWPAYGFAHHKGYGAPRHLRAIADHGALPCHRLSWRTFTGDATADEDERAHVDSVVWPAVPAPRWRWRGLALAEEDSGNALAEADSSHAGAPVPTPHRAANAPEPDVEP